MPFRIEKLAAGEVTTALWIIRGPGNAGPGVGDLILAEPEVIELRDLLLDRFPVGGAADSGTPEQRGHAS